MFKRKAEKALLDWGKSKGNKPLILRGARQVGKSTLVEKFGKSYKQFLSLNLERSKDASFFIGEDDVKLILDKILLEKSSEFIPGETLLFIDEIQEVPEVIALLRYFYEDFPALDVIAAGSLLEFSIQDVPSFPVGRIEQFQLFPLDFEEFLEALGENKALEYYLQVPMSDLAHDKLLELFNRYIIIGGMPEVVSIYVKNGKDVSSLQKVYSSIWDNYVNDIEKYGKNQSERKILRHIIATAPAVRDRISFEGFGNSSYRSRDVGEAFRKLDKAGLIRLIYPTSDTTVPLTPNFKRKPKIQFLDTGLLNYASGIQASLLGVKDLNSLYRGYITNHMMVQELIARSGRLSYVPVFWTREKANSNAEVDILIQYKTKLIPIEVKSGAKGRLRSLHEYIDRSDHAEGIRLLANHFLIDEGTTRSEKVFRLFNIPYYAVGRIKELIEQYID